MSPLYATAADRRNEAEVRDALAAAWKCEVRQYLDDLCPLDFWAARGRVPFAVGEIKCRTFASDQYPTTYLSLRKALALHWAEFGQGVPAVFVVGFTNEIRAIRVTARMGTVVIAGRYDRGAANDIEPYILVPVDRMKVIPLPEPPPPEPTPSTPEVVDLDDLPRIPF